MAEVLRKFSGPVLSGEGKPYQAQVCGWQREDEMWEGWLEFNPGDGGEVLRTRAETEQSSRQDLLYWAEGLSGIYLEGALERAREPLARRGQVPPSHPFYDRPAPEPVAGQSEGGGVGLLDPFHLYREKGDGLLAELQRLSHQELCAIIRAYELLEEGAVDCEAAEPRDLALLMLGAVRAHGEVPQMAGARGR